MFEIRAPICQNVFGIGNIGAPKPRYWKGPDQLVLSPPSYSGPELSPARPVSPARPFIRCQPPRDEPSPNTRACLQDDGSQQQTPSNKSCYSSTSAAYYYQDDDQQRHRSPLILIVIIGVIMLMLHVHIVIWVVMNPHQQ